MADQPYFENVDPGDEFEESWLAETDHVAAYVDMNMGGAGAMSGQLSEKVKQRRRELAMAAQHEVAVAVSESFMGRTLKVLVEGVARAKQLQAANVSSWEHGLMRDTEARNSQFSARNYLIARGAADAPDIDGRVYVRGKLPIGEFARVKVVGHTDYDLMAEPA